jgi:predicted GNAT family N-acyltransferase
MLSFDIKSPETDEEYDRYFHLRWLLLRAPWNEPEGSEVDDIEPDCFHLMAHCDDEVIAVARLQFNTAREAQIRYMAVKPEYQRQGIGRQIIHRLEREAASHAVDTIVLDARDNAVPFYEALGYRVTQTSYLLFGEIQHYRMLKELTALPR